MAVVGWLAFTIATAASAHEWPSRPIRWVVAGLPGGNADLTARAIAPRLSERLGQQVVKDNRPGAASNIGMELVAWAASDGHTLLFSLTSLVINPLLYKLSFDPLKELVPVAQIASTQFVLVTHAGFPAANVKELLAVAKARPAGITSAHSSGTYQIACACSNRWAASR